MKTFLLPLIFLMVSTTSMFAQSNLRHPTNAPACKLPKLKWAAVTLQRRLEQAGFDAGGQDGVIGQGTRRAIEKAERHFGALGYADSCIDVYETYVLAQMKRAKSLGLECNLPKLLVSVDPDVMDWFVANDLLDRYSPSDKVLNAIAYMRASISYENSNEARGARYVVPDCWISANEFDKIRASDREKTSQSSPAPQATAKVASVNVEGQLSASLSVLAEMRETWLSPSQKEHLEAELAASKDEIARLKGEVVPVAAHEAIKSQLSAVNQILAEKADTSVPLSEFDELKRQLGAANASIADLKDRLNIVEPLAAQLKQSLEKSNSAVRSLESQRTALNATLADLSDSSISLDEHAKTVTQLEAANSALLQLQERVQVEFTPVADHSEALRQISALNETVALLSERTDTFRARWLDSQRVYDAFISECKDTPACSRAMELN